MFNTLSGRFLVLTIIFVMLAEVLIFVPSIARFREDYIMARLERAQIASLALEAEDMISEALEAELLQTAQVYNVVLRRDEARQLMLSSPIPSPVSETYDLRDPSAFVLIRDAIRCLLDTEDRVIRVIGDPVREAGLLIEVTMDTSGLRAAMVDYGVRVLILSAVISVVTAFMLFLAVQRLLVQPIRGVVGHMQSYASAPEDARSIIAPSAKVRELREAENALNSMQNQLTGALKQKEHLAQLGGAVAKISHDLRNILTTAQLFTDRIETSDDPTVTRLAPKLMNSMRRAVHLCETTLAYGKAEEAAPTPSALDVHDLVSEIFENERLAGKAVDVTFQNDVPTDLTLQADAEQMYRVFANLIRNARQALQTAGKPGQITVTASQGAGQTLITVADNGPGLPTKARENLFQAFQGGARKGGSGLGLAIAAELVRGHGGALELQSTDADGTVFTIELPNA